MEGGRVAINVEGSNIGGIGHAQLLFEEVGEVGRSCSGQLPSQPWRGVLHRPSEAIEAPERRNSSEPIWIEKTFSEGKLQVCWGEDLPESVMMSAGVEEKRSEARCRSSFLQFAPLNLFTCFICFPPIIYYNIL